MLSRAVLLAGLAAPPAAAETRGMCGPPTEPVLVVLVESPQQVRAATGVSRAQPLVNEADTVIFGDGRVVTSNLASASEHLNKLGWARRKIEIAGAGTSTRLPPAATTRRRG
jgi:hypothetical protein